MENYYKTAGKIMNKRIGSDTAAIHNRLLRIQCMLELMKQPLFPHAFNMYHTYWDTLSKDPSHQRELLFYKGIKKARYTHRNWNGYDSLYSVQKTGSARCSTLCGLYCYQRGSWCRKNRILTFLNFVCRRQMLRLMNVHLSGTALQKMLKVPVITD